jgi:hypothetical protein
MVYADRRRNEEGVMDKKFLLDHLLQVVNALLLCPFGTPEFWTSSTVGFLMTAWVFGRTGERMDVPNVEGFSSFVATALAVGVLLALTVLVNIFVLPYFKLELNLVIALIVFAVGSLVAAVPALTFWTQARYGNALSAWMVAMISGLMVIYAIHMGFSLAGPPSVGAGQHHNQAIRDALNIK